MSFDEANLCIDKMIERIAATLDEMDRREIGRTEAISMLVGSFLAAAQRVNPQDVAVEHALCLVRLVEWRDLIAHLEDEADMLHACLGTLNGLENL